MLHRVQGEASLSGLVLDSKVLRLADPHQLLKSVAFAGIITAVSAWSIWGGDIFPSAKSLSGLNSHSDTALPAPLLTVRLEPETWSDAELVEYLEKVRQVRLLLREHSTKST